MLKPKHLLGLLRSTKQISSKSGSNFDDLPLTHVGYLGVISVHSQVPVILVQSQLGKPEVRRVHRFGQSPLSLRLSSLLAFSSVSGDVHSHT